jgi:hypothetical protein
VAVPDPWFWDMPLHGVRRLVPAGKDVTLPLFVANGVTGVRDMGGELSLASLAQEIAAGTLIGPRMVISGPMLDSPQPRFPSSSRSRHPRMGAAQWIISRSVSRTSSSCNR